MQRFVVTHTKEGFWSVSCQEQTLAVHLTEEQALTSAFMLASRCSKLGLRTVVSLTSAAVRGETHAASDLVSGSFISLDRRPAAAANDVSPSTMTSS
jgi:hypothetical protein